MRGTDFSALEISAADLGDCKRAGEVLGPQAKNFDPLGVVEVGARRGGGRAGRDAARAAETTRALETAAAGTENVLPRIRACVEARVTLGEISGLLRRVWGEYRP